jgi:hypothetical protein
MDTGSSLLQKLINRGQISFITLAAGVDVAKLFFVVIDGILNKLEWPVVPRQSNVYKQGESLPEWRTLQADKE